MLRLSVYSDKIWFRENLKNIFEILNQFIKNKTVDWFILLELAEMFLEGHDILTNEEKDLIINFYLLFLIQY